MARFAFRALDAAGELIEGERESEDRTSLIAELRREGLRPLHAERRRDRVRLGRLRIAPAGRRMDAPALALFTRELATLLGAGLPLDQVLAAVAERGEEDAVGRTARRLLDRVRGGAALSDALDEQREVFPGYYVGLVCAGEAGGTLPAVVAELAGSLEQAAALRAEIRSALVYPVLVLVTAGASVLILLVGVVPEFEPLFSGAGGDLPPSTRLVLAASQGLRAWWWALLVPLVLLAASFRHGVTRDRLRALRDRHLLDMPLIGPLLRKIEAGRFCRTLGTLVANGVEIVPALGMAANTLANVTLSDAVSRVAPRLRRGEGLHDPLAAAGILPPLAQRLVGIGEQSGQLSAMLLTVARIYDEDTRREMRKLVSLIVPAVTLLLGVLVAGIIAAILSAILTSYDLPF